jgi:chemotaxis protein CheX
MNEFNPKAVASEECDSWAPLLGLAAREVFERMLGSRLLPAPELSTGEESDVTSMVGLAGQVCGVMTVRCPTKAAVLMASKMLGVDAAQAGTEMWDAVGEVCNMIAGNFKNKIVGMGDGCMLSVPTVITGVDYNLHPLTNSSKTDVHLVFEGFPLVISLEVHN